MAYIYIYSLETVCQNKSILKYFILIDKLKWTSYAKEM